MKHVGLSIAQYKNAITKLSPDDKNKLIGLYYHYPAANMAELSSKFKIGSVIQLNLLIGKLSKEIAYHANFTHAFAGIEGFTGLNKNSYLIHKERKAIDKKTYNESFYWEMVPALSQALEEMKLVTPKVKRKN